MILGTVGEWLVMILGIVGEWFLMILITNVEGGHFRQHALRFGLNDHRAVSDSAPESVAPSCTKPKRVVAQPVSGVDSHNR